MKVVQAAEAKAKFSALLSDVERGEIVSITRHGKTIARLVPPEADEQERRERAVDRLKAWRKTLPPTGMTVDDILSARDEGRKP
ncbi:type II toxin-antitoxin system prevent-host-death family antitoxin [Mesorhizobium sp. IMUNJ 23232]|uniref:type II toxin-antitoxin system prevent-host-death family antitoxin n=1 Tax=Mesorhizobium sp. IMUNJ 23232 TaxID=3376064 RepID=UPI0037A578AF